MKRSLVAIILVLCMALCFACAKKDDAKPQTNNNTPAPTNSGDVQGNDAEGSDVEGSDAEGSDLEGSDAEGSDLEGSDAEGSDLEGSDAEESDED